LGVSLATHIRHAYLEVLPLVKGDVILSLSPDGNCPVAAIPEFSTRCVRATILSSAGAIWEMPKAKMTILSPHSAIGCSRTVNILHGGNYTDAIVRPSRLKS
jgi:hypothetical protein